MYQPTNFYEVNTYDSVRSTGTTYIPTAHILLVEAETAPTGVNAKIWQWVGDTLLHSKITSILVAETPATVAAENDNLIALTRTAETGGGTVYVNACYPHKLFDRTTYREIRYYFGANSTSIRVTETVVAIQALLDAASTSSVVPYTNTIWVRGGGNDGTAVIGNEQLPYLSVQAAVDAATALSNGGTVRVGVGSTWPTTVIYKTNVTIELDSEIRLLSHTSATPVFSDGGVSAGGVTINLNGVEISLDNAGASILSVTAAGTNMDLVNANFLRSTSTATDLWEIDNGTARLRMTNCSVVGTAAETNPLFTMVNGTVVMNSCRFWHMGATGNTVYIDNASPLTGALQLTNTQIKCASGAESINGASAQTVHAAGLTVSVATPLGITVAGDPPSVDLGLEVG